MAHVGGLEPKPLSADIPFEEADMPRSAQQIEELANAASHGLACLLALAAWPTLMANAQRSPHTLHEAGVSVFVLTMLLMYLVSTLYHAAPDGSAKLRLRRLDHAAIFLFIAGSCTPFAIGHAESATHLPQLGVVWAAAMVGVLLKLADRLRQPVGSTMLYLGFGWLAAAAALPASGSLNSMAWTMLIGGGVAYTVGSIFFLLGRHMRYGHLVWHLLVVTGSICHLQALLHNTA